MGRITIETGQPLAFAEVEALRPQLDGNRRILLPMGRTEGNARGEYRIEGLPPDRYYIAALDPNDLGTEDATGRKQMVQTLFPGVSKLGAAERVELSTGGTRTNIDFPLVGASRVSVRGQLVHPDEARLATGSVSMNPASDGGLGLGIARPAVVRPDGVFDFFDRFPRTLPPAGQRPHQPRTKLSTAVWSTDTQHWRGCLRLAPARSSEHRRRGCRACPQPRRASRRGGRDRSLGHHPRPRPTRYLGERAGRRRHDRLRTHTESGRRERPLYAGDAGRAAGHPARRVTDPLVVGVGGLRKARPHRHPGHLRSGDTREGGRLVVTDRLTRLTGTVHDQQGRVATDPTVVALPVNPALWQPRSRHVRLTYPAASGRYTMTGLPAGAYLTSVVPGIYEGDLYGAAVFQEIAAAGVEVAIEAREITTFDLTLPR
jgi:hypothetical protein